ncbi:hypothetical protein AQI95_24905 [Streptomyces yokosukanensis]|uniref:Uncharacterized protein n=1 Tax=Streptomyces yokosukanensis TaxID=67386 RepID=A0A101P0T3_9ACTN|nr:hypothetical protein [Streptomyces yokosukanensis]KUN02783.1 hypothetical protein AQI95_24905 [Streptomyces yokosukanensis]
MAPSFQTGITGITPVYPLHEAPLPQTKWVDSKGETWVPAGHTSDGELILACPNPSTPEDAGEGPSYPWTLTQVEAAFGPLTAKADVEEHRLVEVDTEFLEMYGPDQRAWKRWQVEQYEAAMAKEFAKFTPREVAA